jgi:hypothetical protein
MAQQASSPGAKAPAGAPKVAEEMGKIQYEPFLPIERKLVTWSLILGAVLLVVLVWTSYTFFTG